MLIMLWYYSAMNILDSLFRYRRIPKLNITFDKGDTDKPTIILLHGLAATTKTWDPLLKKLDTKEYRVIALDLLGFGSSPAPQDIDYTVDQHVAAICKTIKHQNIKKPFILVGHSMGSIISAHYCKKYPNDVKHAVLVSLPLYLDEHLVGKKSSKKLNSTYIEAYRYFRENPDFTKSGAKHIRKIFKVSDGIEVTDKSWVSFSRSLQNTIENQNVVGDIADTTVPITEIHGRLDEVIIEDNMKQLNKLKGVEVITISLEDHLITNRFATKILEQINKI